MEDSPDAKTVWFAVGNQSFCIGDAEDMQGAEWMRDMFGKAMLNFADKILAIPTGGVVEENCKDKCQHWDCCGELCGHYPQKVERKETLGDIAQ